MGAAVKCPAVLALTGVDAAENVPARTNTGITAKSNFLVKSFIGEASLASK